ncbi:helix-turn-helix transcriptional regulator [Halobaculum magnesiiphilum]|uniref:PadR family transcriptional regulator n=1 Tax=Halobaculum magnesiiphilum TaxID=1017351 RepID=A0A8T8WHM4_9EURY|nr:helix-turn-helix transcriptional regulator [Halobaculum magnesiiphilum]QZP39253.1 PadR family transcriptional regulator [Halobaculum magnesiiphilum]
MNGLTAFQRDILYVITGIEEPYGLAIKDELDGYYETEINHGRLYPNLDALVEQGLVEKGKLDDRTNRYTLTSQARRLFGERRDWENERISGGTNGLNVLIE